jgi:hypothetical protein
MAPWVLWMTEADGRFRSPRTRSSYRDSSSREPPPCCTIALICPCQRTSSPAPRPANRSTERSFVSPGCLEVLLPPTNQTAHLIDVKIQCARVAIGEHPRQSRLTDSRRPVSTGSDQPRLLLWRATESQALACIRTHDTVVLHTRLVGTIRNGRSCSRRADDEGWIVGVQRLFGRCQHGGQCSRQGRQVEPADGCGSDEGEGAQCNCGRNGCVIPCPSPQ